jgi:dihydrofolate reductase
MPELLIDFITSLDGYAAAEGWPGWWGLQGPEYLSWLAGQPEANYTVLMGATTYRVMSGFAANGEPGTDALAGMSKVVFSTTLTEPKVRASSGRARSRHVRRQKPPRRLGHLPDEAVR